eukprot:ANDGO_03039.mRNA.1 hypothetical protein
MTSYVSASAADGGLIAVYDAAEEAVKDVDPPEILFQALRVGLVREKRAHVTGAVEAESLFLKQNRRMKNNILMYPKYGTDNRLLSVSFALQASKHSFCEHCMKKLDLQTGTSVTNKEERMCSDCHCVRYCNRECWTADLSNHPPHCSVIRVLGMSSVSDVLLNGASLDDEFMVSKVKTQAAMERHSQSLEERNDLYATLSSWTNKARRSEELPVNSEADGAVDVSDSAVENMNDVIDRLSSYRQELFDNLSYASHTHLELANNRKMLSEVPGAVKTEFVMHYQLLDVIVKQKQLVREKDQDIANRQKRIAELEKRLGDIRTEQAIRSTELYQKISGLEEQVAVLRGSSSGEVEKQRLLVEALKKEARMLTLAAQDAAKDLRDMLEELQAVPRRIQMEMDSVIESRRKSMLVRFAKEEEEARKNLDNVLEQIRQKNEDLEAIKESILDVEQEKVEKEEKKKREKADSKRSFYDRFDPDSDASIQGAMTVLPYYRPVTNPALEKDFSDSALRYRTYDRKIMREKAYLLWQNLMEKVKLRVLQERCDRALKESEDGTPAAPLVNGEDAVVTDEESQHQHHVHLQQLEEGSNEEEELEELEELESSDSEGDASMKLDSTRVPSSSSASAARVRRRKRHPKPSFSARFYYETMNKKWTSLRERHARRLAVWNGIHQNSLNKFLTDMVHATNISNRKAGPQAVMQSVSSSGNLEGSLVDGSDVHATTAGSGFDYAKKTKRPPSATAKPGTVAAAVPSTSQVVPVQPLQVERIDSLSTLLASRGLSLSDIIPQSEKKDDWAFFLYKVVEYINSGMYDTVMEIHRKVEENRKDILKIRRAVQHSMQLLESGEMLAPLHITGIAADRSAANSPANAGSAAGSRPTSAGRPLSATSRSSRPKSASFHPSTYFGKEIEDAEGAAFSPSAGTVSCASFPRNSWELNAVPFPSSTERAALRVQDQTSRSSSAPSSSGLCDKNATAAVPAVVAMSAGPSEQHPAASASVVPKQPSRQHAAHSRTDTPAGLDELSFLQIAPSKSSPISPSTNAPSGPSIAEVVVRTSVSKSAENAGSLDHDGYAGRAAAPSDDAVKQFERAGARNLMDLYNIRMSLPTFSLSPTRKYIDSAPFGDSQLLTSGDDIDRERANNVAIRGLEVKKAQIQQQQSLLASPRQSRSISSLSIYDVSTRSIRSVLKDNPDLLASLERIDQSENGVPGGGQDVVKPVSAAAVDGKLPQSSSAASSMIMSVLSSRNGNSSASLSTTGGKAGVSARPVTQMNIDKIVIAPWRPVPPATPDVPERGSLSARMITTNSMVPAAPRQPPATYRRRAHSNSRG